MKMSEVELRDLYWGRGLSCVDIAATVSRDPKTVWSWMKSYGIETRHRGHNDAVWLKPGNKSCVGRTITPKTREKLRLARVADGSKGLFRPDGSHVLKGRRGADHPSWKGGSTPARQAFYASEEWKSACVAVWHRADARCERCGMDHRAIDRNRIKFHVHHVASFSAFPDLRADQNNLRLLCAPCHRWVHGRENINGDFLEGKNAT